MSSITLADLPTSDSRSTKIRDALDSVAITNSMGQISTAMFDTIYGINHRQTPNSVPINRDYYGLTFFTRPNMNLTRDNIAQVREFLPMLGNDDKTLARAIRAILDVDSALKDFGSPLVDPQQAFIPILTNQLESMSGWPDVNLQFFSTPAGAYGEEVSFVDGGIRIYRAYDIRANFRNLAGDPITSLFLIWCYYQSMVFQGIMIPYMRNLIQNTIDYNTRIYRLVLDETRRYVQKIGACGAAFPIDVPIGNAFNLDMDGPINRANEKITVTFLCNGAIYQDPILIHEFNQTVGGQNAKMVGTEADRARFYKKLSPLEASLFNHRGYPYIDPETYELQWWVTAEDYAQILSAGLETDVLDDF